MQNHFKVGDFVYVGNYTIFKYRIESILILDTGEVIPASVTRYQNGKAISNKLNYDKSWNKLNWILAEPERVLTKQDLIILKIKAMDKKFKERQELKGVYF
jgi:hypothetical protein